MLTESTLYDVEQGSDEWLRLRAGVISASNFFHAVRRKKDGALYSDAIKHAARLAIERISGYPLDEGFQTWQMKRGREQEDIGAGVYAARSTGYTIQKAGFLRTNDGLFGCSADRLLFDGKSGELVGGMEVKCPVDADKIVLAYSDPQALLKDEYIEQVHGCIWLYDVQWWDWVVYTPQLASVGRDLLVTRVYRDDAYCANLTHQLGEFNALVEKNRAVLAGGAAA